jgi:hypothetical protein
MTKSIEYDKVVKLFHHQTRSADLWIAQYEKYKDAGGVRSAALAIGKVMGIFNIILNMKGDENVEEDILAQMNKYSQIWDNLVVEKGE